MGILMVSHSPVVAPQPTYLPGDLPIIGISQSNDLFYGPIAHTAPIPGCYFVNPMLNPDPANWTIHEGRDALEGYGVSADNYPYMPPLLPGQHRGQSTWTSFMSEFAAMSQSVRDVKLGGAKRLFVALCGEPGTPIASFIPGTAIFNRVVAMHRWFKLRGWTKGYINFAKGQYEAGRNRPPAEFINGFNAMLYGLRFEGVDWPIILDIDCKNRMIVEGPNAGTPAGDNFENLATDAERIARYKGEYDMQAAQRSCLNAAMKVYFGIDRDAIPGRGDGCHYTDADCMRMVGKRAIARLAEQFAAGQVTIN